MTDLQFGQMMDGSISKFLNGSISKVATVCSPEIRRWVAEVIDTIEELPFVPPPTHLRRDHGPEFITNAEHEEVERLQCGLHLTRFTIGQLIRGIVHQPVQG